MTNGRPIRLALRDRDCTRDGYGLFLRRACCRPERACCEAASVSVLVAAAG